MAVMTWRAESAPSASQGETFQFDGFTDSDAPVLAGELHDLTLQFGHGPQHDLLALHLFLQAPRLLGQ
jgi:hypothetical protein